MVTKWCIGLVFIFIQTNDILNMKLRKIKQVNWIILHTNSREIEFDFDYTIYVVFGISNLTFLCTRMIINSRGWVLFLQYNKTITCFTTLLRFLFTTKRVSNKFKLSKVYCSLYNTHICSLSWWRSMSINSFIIIGYLIDLYYKTHNFVL